MKKNIFLKLLSFVGVSALLFSSSNFSSLADVNEDANAKKQQLEEKMSKISQEKSEIDKHVKNTKALKNQKLGIKKNLDKQVSQKKDEITALSKKITALNSDIHKKTTEILDKEKEIEKNKDLLKSRIKAGYMTPKVNQVESLMDQNKFSTALTFVEYTAKIADHDEKVISNLNEDLNEIKDRKHQIEINMRKVEQNKAKIESIKSDLDKQVSQISAEVYNIQKQEEAYLKDAANLKKQMDQLQAEIARICIQNSESTPYVGGEFAWPVPGYYSISSPYGPRSFDGFHTGTDIAGKGIYGKNVIAANDGKVTFINTTGKGPYGNYVMVSHGGGIVTLYAHLSSFSCSFGQIVTKGDVIGHIGSTGFSTGPHLHFEVRVNGKHTNPMAYFTKK